MSLTLVSFLGLLAFANAGTSFKFEPRIINGEEVKPGEIPYQVSIQLKGRNSHFCGGSVLSNDFVITAAHCLAGQDAKNIQVVAGTVDLDRPVTTRNVAKIIMHEKYDVNDSWKNDIALIKLETPFQEMSAISFVKLPTANDAIKPQAIAVVSGWGSLSVGGPSPRKLQRAHLEITDQKNCAKAYYWRKIHDSQICANNPKVTTGACHGDSGGPLTVNGKLVGIVSWSLSCALRSHPTVYTRVTSFLQWIDTHAV